MVGQLEYWQFFSDLHGQTISFLTDVWKRKREAKPLAGAKGWKFTILTTHAAILFITALIS
jgi:hypothetical protein